MNKEEILLEEDKETIKSTEQKKHKKKKKDQKNKTFPKVGDKCKNCGIGKYTQRAPDTLVCNKCYSWVGIPLDKMRKQDRIAILEAELTHLRSVA